MTAHAADWRADPAHARTLDLIPWHLGGGLDDAEAAELEAHLAACAHCRAELEQERRLKAAVAELPIEVERGWARLAGRISADRRAPPRRRESARPERRRAAPGLIAAGLGGAFAAGVALTLASPFGGPPRREAGSYHGLAATPAASLRLAVMFRPLTREADLRRILAAAGARVVDGPTAAGAWVLTTAPAARPAALARLRVEPAVAFVQPLDGPPP